MPKQCKLRETQNYNDNILFQSIIRIYFFVSKLCFPQLLVTVTNINGVLEYHTYPSASDIFENGRPSVN